jgi:ABC-type antimicrobial peptide transport system permease subunit
MAGNPLTDPKWATEFADTIERVVGQIRRRTTDKIILLARALVYGLIAGCLGLVVFLLAVIGSLRGIQSLLDLAMPWSRAVWVSYLLLGGILLLLGLLMMKKRRPRAVS